MWEQFIEDWDKAKQEMFEYKERKFLEIKDIINDLDDEIFEMLKQVVEERVNKEITYDAGYQMTKKL